jgi:hypothetical protein
VTDKHSSLSVSLSVIKKKRLITLTFGMTLIIEDESENDDSKIKRFLVEYDAPIKNNLSFSKSNFSSLKDYLQSEKSGFEKLKPSDIKYSISDDVSYLRLLNESDPRSFTMETIWQNGDKETGFSNDSYFSSSFNGPNGFGVTITQDLADGPYKINVTYTEDDPLGRDVLEVTSSKDFKETGTLTWKDGSKYIGQVNGEYPHGEGTKFYPEGDSFTGQWSYGQKNGIGAYYDRNGKVWRQGEWKNGEYIGAN